jgi:hypothetical protein
MAAQRVAMRNIKECLRLKFEADLSHEKIARALQLSKGVVSKYIKAARYTGPAWPSLALLDGWRSAPPWCLPPSSSTHAATACCPT